MTIYTSPFPPTPLPRQNIFHHLFSRTEPHNPAWGAYIDGITKETITRGQMESTSRTLALGLRSGFERLGGGAQNISKGSVIMVFSPNTLSYPLVVLAALAAGIRTSFASSSYTPPELAYQINDSQPTHIFVHPTLFPVLRDALKILNVDDVKAKQRVVLLEKTRTIPPQLISEGWIKLEDLMVDRRELSVENFDGDKADETALIFYSSGTTGLPKGVELTHYNITSMMNGFAACEAFPWKAGSTRVVGILPFYHVYGCLMLALQPLQLATTSIILPKFEPRSFLSAIQTFKANLSFVAPPIVLFFANAPVVNEFDLSSLSHMISAAAPLSSSLIDRVLARINKRPGHRVGITQGFGITELSPGSHGTPYFRQDKAYSVGLLLPNLEARLVGEEGNDVDDGEAGEMYIRGPTVMKGYLNKPTATRNSITSDGWFKTGDVAIRDEEGFYSIVDRKKELIKYKGFQVAPAELENVLITHPLILDAGVIGVYDPNAATELPRAYVVPRDLEILKTPAKADRTGKEVAAWVKERVSHYKQLRGGIVLVNQIPRSAAGKILRKDLRVMAEKEMAEAKPVSARL